MCGCEPGFVCPKCAGTRLADDYLDDEPRERVSPWDEEPLTFEKTPNTKYGNGSSRAANKGKVKRRLKGYR